jgi:hypothetical protein
MRWAETRSIGSTTLVLNILQSVILPLFATETLIEDTYVQFLVVRRNSGFWAPGVSIGAFGRHLTPLARLPGYQESYRTIFVDQLFGISFELVSKSLLL